MYWRAQAASGSEVIWELDRIVRLLCYLPRMAKHRDEQVNSGLHALSFGSVDAIVCDQQGCLAWLE